MYIFHEQITHFRGLLHFLQLTLLIDQNWKPNDIPQNILLYKNNFDYSVFSKVTMGSSTLNIFVGNGLCEECI